MAQGMEPGLWGQLGLVGGGLPYLSIRGWRERKSAGARAAVRGGARDYVVAVVVEWDHVCAPRSAPGLRFMEPGCALAGASRFAAYGAGVAGIGWGVAARTVDLTSVLPLGQCEKSQNTRRDFLHWVFLCK